MTLTDLFVNILFLIIRCILGTICELPIKTIFVLPFYKIKYRKFLTTHCRQIPIAKEFDNEVIVKFKDGFEIKSKVIRKLEDLGIISPSFNSGLIYYMDLNHIIKHNNQKLK